ncbi:MAG: type 1 glutamine amidotransferase [Mycobacterium sp.]
MARKVLFIVNDPVATGGLLTEPFAGNGFDVENFEVVPWSRVGAPAVDVTFPEPGGYDVVVALGARWAAYDATLPWVGEEIRLLRDAHTAGVAVLGVCFGSQLLAAAHGGAVSRSAAPELGWSSVDTDDSALVPPGPWFQWHFDRWTLPSGATEIARNAAASQAFVVGRSLALQFHPELDRALLAAWIADGDERELSRRTVELGADARDRTRQLVRGFIARADGQERP